MNPSSSEREVSTPVVVGRFVVLLSAIAAFIAAMALSRRFDDAAANSIERYVCPMHAQVVSATPGDCPICAMALERVHDAKPTFSTATPRGVLGPVRRRLVTQVVRSPARIASNGIVTAVLHKDSLLGLAPGAEARFFRGTEPAKAIKVRLTAEPATPWDASTVRVDFVEDQVSQLQAETGWLLLDALPRDCLVVAESSVLYASDGAYVLVAAARERAFLRRNIQIGRRLDSGYAGDQDADRLGEIVVLSGLSEGENVAVADTFFLDAERRMRAAENKNPEAVQ